jgi:hypothetical protein
MNNFLTETVRKSQCEKYAEYLVKFSSKIQQFREEGKFLPIKRNKYPLGRIMLEFSRKPKPYVSPEMSIDCKDTLEIFNSDKLQITYGKYFPDYESIGLCGECEKLREELAGKTEVGIGENGESFMDGVDSLSYPTSTRNSVTEVSSTRPSTKRRSKSARPRKNSIEPQFASSKVSNGGYMIPDYVDEASTVAAIEKINDYEVLCKYLLVQLYQKDKFPDANFNRIYIPIKKLFLSDQTDEYQKELLSLIAKNLLEFYAMSPKNEEKLKGLFEAVTFVTIENKKRKKYPMGKYNSEESLSLGCANGIGMTFGSLNAILLFILRIHDNRLEEYLTAIDNNLCPTAESAKQRLKANITFKNQSTCANSW